MAVKRGLEPPAAMLKVLAAVNRASTTETAKSLGISTDRASELVRALQNHGLVRTESHPLGGRGRPRRVATLTDRGKRVLKLLQGQPGGMELRERDFRLLLQRALEGCKRCRSTEPLGPACIVVASYAHLLGMDWERGVPVCCCQRWPKRAKPWTELVEG
jgi:DNA-binding MarR family transcriptional regulator